MIYSISGNEVTKAYNCNGTAVENAYDIQGNQVYTDIDVTGVVSFYKQDVRNAVTYLRDLGEEYVSYAIVNDQHYNYNYGYSPQILSALYRNNVIDKIFVLGDEVDTGADSALLNSWLSDHNSIIPYSFVIQGNHEAYGDESIVYPWFKTNVYDEMATPTNWGTEDHSYYYYDNSEYKIRFIFCDPNHDSTNQKSWLYSTAQAIPEDWFWVLITHEAPFVYTPPAPYDTYWHYRDTTLFGTFETDFATDDKLIGVFCGHEHCDIPQTNSGIHQETFLTDSNKKSGGTDSTGLPMPIRNANDNSANSVTIISINPTLRKVKLLRIGPLQYEGGADWIDKKREFEF